MPDAKSVLESWFEAVEAMDVEQITGLLADDFSMETETLRTPIRGKHMVGEMLAGAMDAYESIRVAPRQIVASGREAAAFVEMRVRFQDDLEMMGERLPTEGKELNVMAALFIEVNDEGRIRRAMRVRDTLGLARQLGLGTDQVRELTRKFEERMKKEPPRAA